MKFAATLALALLLWLTPPASALDEGVPDQDRHPSVGMLGYDLDGAGPQPAAFLCSGSVLSNRHFLTAAHCITVMPPGIEWVVTLAPGTLAAPVYRPGIFPEDFPFPLIGPAVRGGVATVHPEFDAKRLAHDVAVVTFPKGSFASVETVKIARWGLLDRLPRRPSVRLVGYGADPERGDGAPLFLMEGYRQTRTTRAVGLTSRQLQLEGGLCFGDSGSPQFLRDTNIVVSLFSDPGGGCAGPFVSQRLDRRSERRFLMEFVRL